MENLTPDDIFGLGIFGFFLLAVLTFFYITWKFMKNTGSPTKRGERAMMWMAVIGVILVLVYAMFAFIFKIIL